MSLHTTPFFKKKKKKSYNIEKEKFVSQDIPKNKQDIPPWMPKM